MKCVTFHMLQNIRKVEKGDRNISEKSVDYDDTEILSITMILIFQKE